MTPFIIHEYKIFAPITVGGASSYAFVDTGSNQVSIAESLAEGIERYGHSTLRGAFGDKRHEVVNVEKVEFLGHALADVKASVEAAGSYDDLPFTVGMSIGAPILNARPLLLDFSLLRIGYDDANAERGVAIPLSRPHSLLIFTMEIDGRASETIFDTGAGITTINAARIEELGVDLVPGDTLDVHDTNGVMSSIQLLHTPRLSVAGVELGPAEMLAIDMTGIEEAIGHRVDLVLGASTMLRSAKRWRVDAERLELRVW